MDLWVFDNDGTLYDDSGTKKNFMEIFFEYASNLLGVPNEEVATQLSKLKNKWRTEFSVVVLMKEFGVDYSEVVNSTYLRVDFEKCNVPKNDHVRKAVLDNILAEKIVFTNNPAVFARRVLSYVGLEENFSSFVGMEEAKFFGKPDPRAFKIVEARHPKCSRIIFCDDSLKNLDVAHQMGWVTIWYRPRSADVETNDKHIIINSFSDINGVLL